MAKLLVTGASGFLGGHLCQLAQQQGWQVYGTYWSQPITLPQITTFQSDLRDFQALQALIHELRPDAIIHTAAQARANLCQADPAATTAINVGAAWNLAGLCADAQIPCLFTSTDLVFDGSQAPYRETDAVNPVNQYGEQKAEAEQGMLERYPQVTICRLPLMFGPATATATCFLQPYLQALQAGQPIHLFIDEFRTPVSVLTAAQGLLDVLNTSTSGILHLGGRERISRYALGHLIAEVLQLDATGLHACSQQDVVLATPRPADVSLDSSKAFALGYAPEPLSVAIAHLREYL